MWSILTGNLAVPAEFAGMTPEKFKEILTGMPYGYRLYHQESWRECIWVRNWLGQLAICPNPLNNFLPKHLKCERLEGRLLWISFAYIRWFGTNCGWPTLEGLMAKQKLAVVHTTFQSEFRGGKLYSPINPDLPMGLLSTGTHLELLLDEGPRFGKRYPHGNRSTANDHQVARALMKWLDSAPGEDFLERTVLEVECKLQRRRVGFYEMLRQQQRTLDRAA